MSNEGSGGSSEGAEGGGEDNDDASISDWETVSGLGEGEGGGSADPPRFPICSSDTDVLDEYIVRDERGATIFGVFKKDDENHVPFALTLNTWDGTIGQFVGLIQIIGDKVKILRLQTNTGINPWRTDELETKIEYMLFRLFLLTPEEVNGKVFIVSLDIINKPKTVKHESPHQDTIMIPFGMTYDLVLPGLDVVLHDNKLRNICGDFAYLQLLESASNKAMGTNIYIPSKREYEILSGNSMLEGEEWPIEGETVRPCFTGTATVFFKNNFCKHRSPYFITEPEREYGNTILSKIENNPRTIQRFIVAALEKGPVDDILKLAGLPDFFESAPNTNIFGKIGGKYVPDLDDIVNKAYASAKQKQAELTAPLPPEKKRHLVGGARRKKIHKRTKRRIRKMTRRRRRNRTRRR